MDHTCLRILSATTIGWLLAAQAIADPAHEMPPYQGSNALQRIKALAGDWIGVKNQPDGSQKQVHVTYRTTSNGSAVVETIFKDTPMEMTSVYFDREGQLTMTHYCAVANRPTLKLVGEDDEGLDFEYADGEEMDPSKDMHIHGLRLEIKSDSEIVQHWLGYEGGQATHSTVVTLKRASGP